MYLTRKYSSYLPAHVMYYVIRAHARARAFVFSSHLHSNTARVRRKPREYTLHEIEFLIFESLINVLKCSPLLLPLLKTHVHVSVAVLSVNVF